MPKLGAEPIRRAETINAALECICEVGIDSITLEMVAAKAGCSKGVVAYYFKTKQQLILECLRAFLSYYKIKIGHDTQSIKSPDKILDAFLEHGLPVWDHMDTASEKKLNVSDLSGIDQMYIPSDRKAKLFIQFFSRAAIDEAFQNIIVEVYRGDVEGISQLISYGIKIGAFNEANAGTTAYGLLAMLVGLSFFRVIGFMPEGQSDNRGILQDYIQSLLKKGATP